MKLIPVPFFVKQINPLAQFFKLFHVFFLPVKNNYATYLFDKLQLQNKLIFILLILIVDRFKKVLDKTALMVL